jgi:hypothetical protein
MQLGVADAAGEELDDDLLVVGLGQLYFIDDQRSVYFELDGGACFNDVSPLEFATGSPGDAATD